VLMLLLGDHPHARALVSVRREHPCAAQRSSSLTLVLNVCSRNLVMVSIRKRFVKCRAFSRRPCSKEARFEIVADLIIIVYKKHIYLVFA